MAMIVTPDLWVIEGELSVPGDVCTRVCHREYTRNRRFAIQVYDLRSITFADGAVLMLRVRKHTGRRQLEIPGFRKLIRDCIGAGVNSVADLHGGRQGG